MGLMDSITNAVSGMAGGENAKVAGGLLDVLREHPGGVGGVMQQMQQNGQGEAVQQWANGNTENANQGQVESGLGGTGIIDMVAQRTGLSPTVVKGALVVILPLVVHHMTSSGHVTPDGQPTGEPAPEHSGLLQMILSRLG